MLILGDYQTGKTTLAKAGVLARSPRRLVWDPTYAFGDRQRDWDSAVRFFEQYGRCTYQPGRGDLDKKFDKFCEFALQQANAMVFIDEPAMLGNSRKLPQSFHDLHRLGHKRGVGVTIASHSVWDLPHVTQTYHHLFCFRVTRIVDVNALRQMLPEDAVTWIQHAPDYHFWYQNPRGGQAMKPIKLGPRSTDPS